MAPARKSTSSRPKAKKPSRPVKAATRPAAKPKAAKASVKASARASAKASAKAPAKAPAKAAPKKAAGAPAATKAGARPLAPVKGGGKPASGAKGKLKSAQRPPAVVHPLGVLPPEAISRVPQKPARPAPAPPRAPKPARTSANDAGAKPLTAKDFPEFEQRLHGDRMRVLKEMGHYENTVLKVNQRDSSGDLSGYSFHMADVGTDAMEREKAFQLASAEGRILLEINEALRRLARGEYGVCESCESPILRARLEAMPTARLCLSCKEKEERAARGMA